MCMCYDAKAWVLAIRFWALVASWYTLVMATAIVYIPFFFFFNKQTMSSDHKASK